MLRHLAGVSVGKNFPPVLSDDFASTENWNLEKIFFNKFTSVNGKLIANLQE
jgi:hypothetical protein